MFLFDTVKGVWEDVSANTSRPNLLTSTLDGGEEVQDYADDEDDWGSDASDDWLSDGIERSIERRTGIEGPVHLVSNPLNSNICSMP